MTVSDDALIVAFLAVAAVNFGVLAVTVARAHWRARRNTIVHRPERP